MDVRSRPTAWKYAEAIWARNPNGAHTSSGRKCEAVSATRSGSSPAKNAEMGVAKAIASAHAAVSRENEPTRLVRTSSRKRSCRRAPQLKLAMGCRPYVALRHSMFNR